MRNAKDWLGTCYKKTNYCHETPLSVCTFALLVTTKVQGGSKMQKQKRNRACLFIYNSIGKRLLQLD